MFPKKLFSFLPKPSALITAYIALLAISPAAAQEDLSDTEVSTKAVAVSEVQTGWTTQAVLSSYVGDNHAEGYMDLLIPLLQNDNGMLFIYPRFGLSSDVDPGYSMGLGVRHYIPAIDAIIGGNVFYDSYDSPGGNNYNQLGLGLEVLTRWVDARFNYYIPDSSPNVIDAQSVSSRSRSTSSAWGQPFATGYSIRQPYTTTTRTTTVNQLFERFEDTMQGFDAEIGVLTPWLEQYVALRWFAGYYNFNNSYGSDVSGLKGRAEIRFSQKLAIDATYYADEEITGSNWLFGVRMTIPIFMENLTHGRSPFQGSFSGMFDGVNMSGRNRESSILRGGSASTYPSSYALSPFAAMAPTPSYASASRKGSTVRDRMTEQLLRLAGARTSQSDFIENLGKRDVDVDIETKTRIVVIDDSIVFVDNARGTAGGPGTFENPLSGIQGGVIRASTLFGNRGDVFVAGTGTTYTEDVVDAGSSVRVWGGARGIPANGGRRFTNGSRPVLDGGFQVANIPEFSLSGFSIVNGFGGGDGVNTNDVASVTIIDNVITGTGDDGIQLDFTNINATFNVTNNQLNGNGDAGLEVNVQADSAIVTGVIEGNAFTGNTDGFDISVDTGIGGVVNLDIRNNISTGNTSMGGSLNLEGDGTVGNPNNGASNVMISGNQFTGNGNDGFDLDVDSDDNVEQNIVVQGNSFSGNSDDGFSLFADVDDAMLSLSFIGNSFLNNGSRGLDLVINGDGEDSAEYNIQLIGNRFESNQFQGLRLSLSADDGDTVTVNFEATGNTFLNNLGTGADIRMSFDSIDDDLAINGVFSNNIVSGNAGNGLDLDIDSDDVDSSSSNFDISGNQFLSNGGNSIVLSVDLDGDDVTFSSTLDNISIGAGGGLSLEDNGTSDAAGSILLNGATINFPNPGDTL